MTVSTAKTKYVRISPRKARLAADLIRGKHVEEALLELQFCGLRGGRLLKKTLDSALANAENGAGEDRKELFVQTVKVDEGPTMKRAKSKNKGGRVQVLKRTSHFTVELGKKMDSEASN